jgi:hypothetical protein
MVRAALDAAANSVISKKKKMRNVQRRTSNAQ